jgi:Flp pilus assembly pilin Flp
MAEKPSPLLYKEAAPMSLIIRVACNQSGATAIEYALIAGGIGVAIASVLGGVGGHLIEIYEHIVSNIP